MACLRLWLAFLLSILLHLEARFISSGHLLLASPSSAAMPVHNDKSRMQTYPANPNRPSSTGIGLSVALLSCPKTYPVTLDVENTAFRLTDRNREFPPRPKVKPVKPLQSRPKVALDTSTDKLRFNVKSLTYFAIVLIFQEEIGTSKNLPEIASCCGRECREKPI